MLPKISYPSFSIEFTDKKYKFRPMLVKEEKILLMAKASEESNDIFESIVQVVNNCALDPTFDITKIALYELEYAFLKLRGFSIGNEIEVSYKDDEDGKSYDFKINIQDVKLVKKETNNKIQINEDLGITLKYPPATLYTDREFLDTPSERVMEELIIRCIDKIYDLENVYDPKLESKEELIEFINTLDVKSYNKIQEFFNDAPYMLYTLEYVNANGKNKTIELKTLNDFFIF